MSDVPAEDAWYASRLVRIDLDDGDATTLHVPEWQLEFATGSPDGSQVAVVEGVASDRYYMSGELLLVAADGPGCARCRPPATRARCAGSTTAASSSSVATGSRSRPGSRRPMARWQETWRAETGEGGLYTYLSPIGRDGDLVTRSTARWSRSGSWRSSAARSGPSCPAGCPSTTS